MSTTGNKSGKHKSDFVREENDFYRTFDPRAHIALNDFLQVPIFYAEPCVGMGDLVKGLDGFGHQCVYASDLIQREIIEGVDITVNQMDIFDLRPHHLPEMCDAIITNPPWERKILHPIITHLMEFDMPVFLLFEADWSHTKQAIPFLTKYCTDIISIGRMKWIPGTNVSGTKDMAWYLFNNSKSYQFDPSPIRFHPRKL